MKDCFYSFNYFKDGKFIEARSFRDTDYYSAKLQAEVYSDRLRYYNPESKIVFKREYNRAR